MKSYSVFILLETFVTEDNFDSYEKFFIGFKIIWIPAVRLSNQGRASGGIIVGIKINKSNINIKISYKIVRERIVINYVNNNVSFLIIPVYLNFNKWESDFTALNEFINYSGQNMILIGDFNAHTGNLQTQVPSEIWDNLPHLRPHRNSRDTCVDRKGKNLLELIENFGGILLNGRSKHDEQGDITFLNSQGASVIDYAIASSEICKNILDFRVLNEIYSDHFPIEIEIRIISKCQSRQSYECQVQKMKRVPRLLWTLQDQKCFAIKISQTFLQSVNKNEPPNVGAVINSIKLASDKSVKIVPKIVNFTKKWFDFECFRKRLQSFRKLQVYRKTNSEGDRVDYLKINKEYRNLCARKRIMYIEKLAESLENLESNEKMWWKMVREINGYTYLKGCNISIDEFFHYFKNLYNPKVNHKIRERGFIDTKIDYLDCIIDINEIKKAFPYLKNNKAAGRDGVPYEFLKNCPEIVLEYIAELFNDIFNKGYVPEEFKISIIFPLHKKGSFDNVNNYRGISFSNSLGKLLTFIFFQRIEEWVDNNNLLNEFQAGFRKNYSTTDNIFNLINIIQFKHPEKIYGFFVDFQAAFDTVPRDCLFYKLAQKGMSFKMLKFLEMFYQNTKSLVWDGVRFSDEFVTKTGLKQGCILSPLLFALYIDDLYNCLSGGFLIAGLKIRILLYADDIVILASRPNQLQTMIRELENYCSEWGLQLNHAKSQIVVFNKSGSLASNEKWFYKDKLLEVVNSYKYLGITLTSKLSLSLHFKQKIATAKYSINCLWNELMKQRTVKHSIKLKIFQSVISSALCYGSQVWGYQQFDVLEKCWRYFIKRIFWLPSNTPKYMITLETGCSSMYNYTLKTHYDYLLKVLKMSPQRLPRLLLFENVRRNVGWYSALMSTIGENGMRISIQDNDISRISETFQRLLQLNRISFWQTQENDAKSGLNHELYPKLCYVNNKYFMDKYTIDYISTIFKIRGSLFPLNASRFGEHDKRCSVCNRNENETVAHFLGLCPIYKFIRKMYFGKAELNEREIICYLNGTNWLALYKYVKQAMNYRKLLVLEFNY